MLGYLAIPLIVLPICVIVPLRRSLREREQAGLQREAAKTT